MKLDNFSFTVTEHIATLSKKGNVTKELNKVSYNGAVPKLDLRSWEHNEEGSQMRKGTTLTNAEAYLLLEALKSLDLNAPEEKPEEVQPITGGTFTSRPFES